MNPDTIALLRAKSLAATLTAARGRRTRRRAGRIALAAIAGAVIVLSILPRPTPAPVIVATSQPAVSLDDHSFHTPPGAVARITTRSHNMQVRFRTDSERRVERIDNDGLARCFPDKGIAVIRAEGELAKVVMF